MIIIIIMIVVMMIIMIFVMMMIMIIIIRITMIKITLVILIMLLVTILMMTFRNSRRSSNSYEYLLHFFVSLCRCPFSSSRCSLFPSHNINTCPASSSRSRSNSRWEIDSKQEISK